MASYQPVLTPFFRCSCGSKTKGMIIQGIRVCLACHSNGNKHELKAIEKKDKKNV